MEEERIDLLAQVAICYYEEGLNQEAIAKRINKSRSMVSRLLVQARDAGLVEVRICYPLRTDSALEGQLCRVFDLEEAHVLANPPEDYQFLLRRLGELGVRCLQESLRPGMTIGLSWGTGVYALVSAMPSTPVPDSMVVQLIGAVGHGDPLVDGAELGRWLAQKLGASFRFLSAPLLVTDAAVAHALRGERINQETLVLAAQADVALIGIGTPEPEYSSFIRAGYMSRGEMESMMAAGVVADVVAHQIDDEGMLVDVPENNRAVNLDADSLRRIPKVIAISGSVSKARAIAAALRGGYCNCLVTDANAAQAVLELQREYTVQRTSRASILSEGQRR